MQAAIYAPAGLQLTPDERAFFRDADPVGYILFRRNIATREQMRALIGELRELQGRDDLPILIDQEGGRVARMRPPEWPVFPAAEAIAVLLAEVGVNVDCLPVLDVRQPGATDIVGDRALGAEPMQVAALGRAVLDGLAAGGVAGVIKHMPGHGRALVDSHKEMPVVGASEAELEVDLEPFRTLSRSPMGMTCHCVFTAWDPERPASQSPAVIADVIRGRIGFDGFLMSDDIGMHALAGGFADRARGVMEAGTDAVLHCSGVMDEMAAVASAAGELSLEGRERLERAMASVAAAGEGLVYEALAEKRDRLLALA